MLTNIRLESRIVYDGPAGTVLDHLEVNVTDIKKLLTVAEAAHRLSIGRSRAYAEIMSGRLPSVKIGARRLVPAAALDEYITSLSEEGRDEPAA